MKKLEQDFKRLKLGCDYSHRNYNWKDNSKDKLPGWNFLEFKDPGFRTFYPWLITYDPFPMQKNESVRVMKIKHPNGVTDILGHEFVINDVGRDFFSKVFGTKIKEEITLNGGEVFYFKKGRSNYHSKVILKSSEFSLTRKFMRNHENISFRGVEGILIQNPSSNNRMWDIVII